MWIAATKRNRVWRQPEQHKTSTEALAANSKRTRVAKRPHEILAFLSPIFISERKRREGRKVFTN
jgi:hypothetical protein